MRRRKKRQQRSELTGSCRPSPTPVRKRDTFRWRTCFFFCHGFYCYTKSHFHLLMSHDIIRKERKMKEILKGEERGKEAVNKARRERRKERHFLLSFLLFVVLLPPNAGCFFRCESFRKGGGLLSGCSTVFGHTG